MAEAGISHILESVRGNYRIVIDNVDCDVYQFEQMLKKNQMKRKEDLLRLEQFRQKGYMETSGYDWAYPRAAELDALCRNAIARSKK